MMDQTVKLEKSKYPKDIFIFGSWKRRKSVKPKLERLKSSCSVKSDNFPTLEKNLDGKIDTKSINRKVKTVSVYDKFYNEDFWCPKCTKRMVEPRLLPCLHPICLKCVYGLIGTNRCGRKNVVCQKCDFPLQIYKGCPIPPPHYSLQHKLILFMIRESQFIVCCETCCEDVQALLHCSTCLRNFCADCGKKHENQQSSESTKRLVHQMTPLSEVRNVRRVAVCHFHESRVLRFYCLACQQVVCDECVLRETHRGHASEDAEISGRRTILQLTTALDLAQSTLKSLLSTLGIRRNSENGNFSSNGQENSKIVLARERIDEFLNFKRIRFLVEAIFFVEDLIANGSFAEILNVKKIVLKRLKYLGVLENFADGIHSNSRLHWGIYHCCTFCSSKGKKESVCACKGKMPGGYNGCGHGHSGHPGSRHWSCCGSLYRNSSCLVMRKSAYTITL